jgi:hypothetical protein
MRPPRPPHYNAQSPNGEYDPNYEPEPLPPPIQLTPGQGWPDSCEKLGIPPTEWMNYSPQGGNIDWEKSRRRLEEVDREQAAVRAAYQAELDWLVAVIGFDRDKVLEVLGIRKCRCGGYCCE